MEGGRESRGHTGLEQGMKVLSSVRGFVYEKTERRRGEKKNRQHAKGQQR